MGIFDFVREAGEKLFAGEEAAAAEVEPQTASVDIEKILVAKVQGLGIPADDFGIAFNDSVATVVGQVQSQADREKIVLAVGNVSGVARVNDMMNVAKVEPEATMYTVKSGDTLSKIAKEFYGSSNKYPVIFEANQPLLENPDRIYPGQVLRIPSLEA